jgi:pyrimidine-nucleoside phosphorylase
MNPVELIRKKRDGGRLKKEEINFLISSYVAKEIPDYQFSAFLMAVFFKGLDEEETSFLTEAMLYSGIVADLSSISGIKVDKHSTGGVGDKTSLIIAPIAASAGVIVPMISGRGLGHTGGTLDKLESITGFRTNLSLQEFINTLNSCGASLIGQTSEIAPADKLIYALRDVTSTVESIPLITASIMSKKLAEGIDGLVLDVKTGSGAFMKDYDDAVTLANSLIKTAKAFDKKVIAFITDMNQPLGNYIGNWLEVYESVKVLKGEVRNDLTELSLTLAGSMIYLGGKADSIEEGKQLAEKQIDNGDAFKKFVEIVESQSGNPELIYDLEKYPKAEFNEEILSQNEGYLHSFDNYEIGMAAVELGAGRLKKEDLIDPAAGIIIKKKIGDFVKFGEPVAELFSSSREKISSAKERLLKSLTFTADKAPAPQIIKKIIM